MGQFQPVCFIRQKIRDKNKKRKDIQKFMAIKILICMWTRLFLRFRKFSLYIYKWYKYIFKKVLEQQIDAGLYKLKVLSLIQYQRISGAGWNSHILSHFSLIVVKFLTFYGSFKSWFMKGFCTACKVCRLKRVFCYLLANIYEVLPRAYDLCPNAGFNCIKQYYCVSHLPVSS